jgi:hypothetical protein
MGETILIAHKYLRHLPWTGDEDLDEDDMVHLKSTLCLMLRIVGIEWLKVLAVFGALLLIMLVWFYLSKVFFILKILFKVIRFLFRKFQDATGCCTCWLPLASKRSKDGDIEENKRLHESDLRTAVRPRRKP